MQGKLLYVIGKALFLLTQWVDIGWWEGGCTWKPMADPEIMTNLLCHRPFKIAPPSPDGSGQYSPSEDMVGGHGMGGAYGHIKGY